MTIQAKRLIDGKVFEVSPSVLRNTFIASNIHSPHTLYVIKQGQMARSSLTVAPNIEEFFNV